MPRLHSLTVPARFAAALCLALLAGLPALFAPQAAQAHPLGNFTINHYSRIELSPERLRVRYVLDMAEIPTFQAMASLDADSNGAVSDAEKRAYATRQLAEIAKNVSLTLDGARVALTPGATEVELLPGQGGLQTLRLAAWLEAPAAQPVIKEGQRSTGGVQLDYRDGNAPDRIGWREVLVRADGMVIQGSGGAPLPTRDLSDELRTYPDDLLQSPLDVRRIQATLLPAGASVSSATSVTDAAAASTGVVQRAAGAGQSLARSRDGFAELISTTTLTPAVVLLALLTATALGAMHALSPGHGKTIVGAYLVGTRGTPKHALFLGLTVTVVHTAGVFALLLATLFASQYVVPEQIFPWMSLVSGALVLWIGVTLVRSRWQLVQAGRRPAAAGAGAGHDHLGGQDHDSAHGHGGALQAAHSHGFGSHSHALPGADGRPVTWRNLLALGISGGLLPCPSALVVGLGAIALDRVAYGLVLILFFSAGLAATLMAIGLAMVFSGRAAGKLRLYDRVAARVGESGAGRLLAGARVAPVLSAGVVALAGLALTADAARQIDLATLWSTSSAFRSLAANALSLGLGALAVLFALRRGRTRTTPVLALAAAEHAHAHPHAHGNNVHGHDHDHGHEHAHRYDHSHGDDGDNRDDRDGGHSHAGGLVHAGSHSHAGHTTEPAIAAYMPVKPPTRQ